MADSSPWQSKTQNMANESAVLDLEGVEMEMMNDTDVSDYEDNREDSVPRGQREGEGQGSSKFVDDVRQRMSENVTQMVWNAGKSSAQKAWTMYGNIDILRPYFDVEPREVQRRLLFSLVPQKPTSQRQRVEKELYGPLMIVLTLIALLLYQMKVSSHAVEEGTLMGSAFVVCFTYWIGTSSFIWFLAYVCNVRIAMLQVLSLLGYGLFGHCVVLFLGTVIHTTHDHLFFYLTWAIVGGLSTLKMACVILSRASGRTERLLVIIAIAILHMCFLLYLHFAYHSVVEELSDMFEGHHHAPIKPVVADRIAEHGLPKNVENAAANIFEKVTKKIAASAVQHGGKIADNVAPHGLVSNSSVKRVLREAMRGGRPVGINNVVKTAINATVAVVKNTTKIM